MFKVIENLNKKEKNNMHNMKTDNIENINKFEAKIPFMVAFSSGIQHALAMFIGNLTPILIVFEACGLTNGDFVNLQLSIIQNAMIVSGIVTLVQLHSIGPIGGKIPIFMGTSSGFLSVYRNVIASMGGSIITYSAIIGANIIGGFFESILGYFLKYLKKFFPPVVTGTIVLSIGLNVIPVGFYSCCGGKNSYDFASIENILLSLSIIIIILFFQNRKNTFLKSSASLIGIICGYIIAFIMGLILPATSITENGITFTKAWVINFDKTLTSSWFAIPKILPVKPIFDFRAIFPILFMFIVTTIETVGDISAVVKNGLDREATDKEIKGGIICDGIGSAFASVFGVLANTSFSQNVGLVAMTKIVNKFALSIGAIFLIVCGLCPKLGTLISVMPSPIIGGATILMFASIIISGGKMIYDKDSYIRNFVIAFISILIGNLLCTYSDLLTFMPDSIHFIFKNSSAMFVALIAIILNITIPNKTKITRRYHFFMT